MNRPESLGALHRRKPLRLPQYDYSQAGAYFVTAVTRDRELLFESPAAQEAVLSAWQAIAPHLPGVELDACVVMPNHVHGIVVLTPEDVPLVGTASGRVGVTLGSIVGFFKHQAARNINALRGTVGQVWQRGYYEHVIRDERGLERIRDYIAENPARWGDDPENPVVPGASRAARGRPYQALGGGGL